ncbi:unnamed protein product [Ilex paraguariensis]|uniref:DNA repair protein RAD16 n=2 Tax=Magnoliopsida TaxID=3398 RepID=A0ABC8SM62_9AQUA
MKLRPLSSRSSIDDNNNRVIEISDEDEDHVGSLDSDYQDEVDKGENSLDATKEYEGGECLDLNLQPEAEIEFIDDDGIDSDFDIEHEVAKLRKVWSKKNRGQPSRNREEEEEEEEEEEIVDAINEEEQVVHELEFDRNKNKKRKRKAKKKGKPILMWEVWEEENETWVSENIVQDIELDNQHELVVETAEPTSDLIMPLLRYQKEWLAWALKQEESAAKGGILADEMGMGKTVQAIALVLAKRELLRATCGPSGLSTLPSTSSSTGLPEIKATLVICPLVAVIQWVGEIDRFTSKGSNKVLLYHGAKRGKSLHEFSEYDFVITTYSTVEAEYRRNVMPPKQKCQWCGKLYHEHRMSVHLKYYCGPDAIRTDKQSKQQRKGQKLGVKISMQKTSAKGKASESVGGKRKGAGKKSLKHRSEEKVLDIGSPIENLAGEEQTLSGSKSILHSVKWNRIILDEAHYIKDRRCNTTKAVLCLESSYKWALSGTPLQNRVGELYSLVRFLQIIPYSFYFCKDCDCRALDYRYCGTLLMIVVSICSCIVGSVLNPPYLVDIIRFMVLCGPEIHLSMVVTMGVGWGIADDGVGRLEEERVDMWVGGPNSRCGPEIHLSMVVTMGVGWGIADDGVGRLEEELNLKIFLLISSFITLFNNSSSTDCAHCPHKSVRHFCWWNKYVAKPIQAHGNVGDGKRAMILLKNKILKSIVLRRTKKGRAADLALPPRIMKLRRDLLDVKEEDYYTSLYNESQSQFNTYIEAGTLMNNYAHIFDLLTRLRQAVDHPYLVVYSSSSMARNGIGVDTSDGEPVCSLCHDPVEDPVVTSCSHVFCKSCLIDFSASVGEVTCPSCSKPLSVDFTTNKDHGDQNTRTTIKGFKPSSILNRIRLDDFQTSTKIDALREEIRFMVERDGSAKGIVFSQFTSFLDLIHYSLQKSGVNCVQLVGSMSLCARDAAISKFTDEPDCRIFLMSLKAGGVALNLTVASHVFLMDPWWNPAVEQQAQDRIHRIGQYKPIRIVRFVIENTVEERILKLQEKKQLVFEGTVGGSSEALGKLTEADMRFLFGS